jgi:3-oxoacyl-[acyl-carrier protein] reductase
MGEREMKSLRNHPPAPGIRLTESPNPKEVPMSTLQGKVAIVTGASKGIGAEIARALAAEGASVVVNYATSREGADRVVADIKKNGGKAVAIQGSVANVADVKRIFADTKKNFGTLDVLVNNAGVYKFVALGDVTEDEFHRQFNTNVLGVLLATREALAYFGPNGGSVINISSIASTRSMPNISIYGATKGAVDAMTRSLAAELGARKIRVNAINPGAVDTEGLRETEAMTDEFKKYITSTTPLGRYGEPADVAPVAVFLASDASRWVTGETLRASGGLQ